jgi:hypothetical protein
MQDDPAIIGSNSKIMIYHVEVKAGTCNLNGPWWEPHRQNMQRVVRAVGAFPLTDTDVIAEALYERGAYEGQEARMSLMCMGKHENRERRRQFPDVPQITWNHILGFIYNRFRDYRGQKRDNSQWPSYGRRLFSISKKCKSGEEFAAHIEVAPITRNSPTKARIFRTPTSV